MTFTPSCCRVFVMAAVAAFPVGCSTMQTPSVAPALYESAGQQLPMALIERRSQNCEHSPHLDVVACHVTFTTKQGREVFVEGSGSGIIRLFNNCKGIAMVSEESGTAFIVIPEKTQGTCVAVFTYKRELQSSPSATRPDLNERVEIRNR